MRKCASTKEAYMECKLLKREIRSERAVRRITAGVAFVAVAIMCILLLTAYLKFTPETGEEITAGKLKQFLGNYENKIKINIVLLGMVAGLSAFLPAVAADLSVFASCGFAIYMIYQRSLDNIPLFPNLFVAMALVYLAVTVYCSMKRTQIANTKGRKFKFSPLTVIASACIAFASVLCIKIIKVKEEYILYDRFTDKTAEDFVEKEWGEFEPILSYLNTTSAKDYTVLAIALGFLAVIVLVLFTFPRLSLLASASTSAYTLYRITVYEMNVMTLPIFFMTVIAVACCICAVSASGKLRPYTDYEPEELDETLDEDDEDEAEYQHNKEALEKRGLDMEEF